MRKNLLFLLVVLLTGCHITTKNETDFNPALSLWYNEPAVEWQEALPIGNGRLGAMIFGKPEQEKLQLNDITVWSGGVEPRGDRKEAYKMLPAIRKALAEKDFVEAERLTNLYMTCGGSGGFDDVYFPSYQTLGNLDIHFDLPEKEIKNYKRWLDIEKALAGTSFQSGNTEFRREYFSSAADSVIVIRLSANRQNQLSFTLDLNREFSAVTIAENENTLVMKGNTDYKGKKGNCDYEVRLKVTTPDGTLSVKNGLLAIEKASEAEIYIVCATSYILDYEKGYYETIPSGKTESILEAAYGKSFNTLKELHIRDYQQLFNRMSIEIGETTRQNEPINNRLNSFGEGKEDQALLALFYQYGRYLMICSSRENNPLPSNSQGIWGDGFELPWHCDYKCNINYQMNYWCVNASNLEECHSPALRLNSSLVIPGRKTAKEYFNAPGWMLAVMTNAWGWTSPGWEALWGSFFGGSGWICQNYWEHYAYTQDKDFLRSVYPVLKEACEFYLGAMIKNKEGYWVMSPSSSPENAYLFKGEKISVTEGSTIDMSIIRDLFGNTIQATKELDMDAGFRQLLEETRQQLLPLRIGKEGQLQEWADDVDMDAHEIHHRHVSHLFGLHPGKEISPLTTPELAEAAKRTLEIRGDDGTGWSLAWKINFWARLLDGDHAYKLMTYQLRLVDPVQNAHGGTYPNLFDAHPPFQIDGNFGFVSGVNEVLLQSHRPYPDPGNPDKICYILDLLPALPSSWEKGEINGLRARGGFELSLQWKEGKLVQTTLKSISGKRARLEYKGTIKEIELQKGETKSFQWN